MEINSRMEKLETRFTHMEDQLAEQNIIIYNQKKAIDLMKKEIEALRSQLNTRQEDLPENERPPHY